MASGAFSAPVPSPSLQASLVVNVASYSEQTEVNYRYLQELHRELGTSHFNVLAFPCGQFGDTEPGTSREIEAFAKSTYGVTFPFFSRIKIMGSEAEPAFGFLTGPRTQQLSIMIIIIYYWLFPHSSQQEINNF